MDTKFRIFDDNAPLFDSMIADFLQAKKSIFFEIYRFGHDEMGERFADVLIQKAKQGLDVRLIADAWGTGENQPLIEKMQKGGVQVRIYHKLILDRGYLAKNHCRNHRKLIIIDANISYLGSSNITAYSLCWRELNLRIEDPSFASSFTRAFKDSYRTYNKYSIRKNNTKRDMKIGDWLFIQDLPTPYRQKIKVRYEKMINNAKKSIVIETPYFLPGYVLRKELAEAVSRGVDVRVITPFQSDVHVVDIIRRHYLGLLHENGVQLMFYTPGNLHAKCLMVDDNIFSISSANFDYRSFRYQNEIALVGKDKYVLTLLRNHIDKTLQNCEAFDYHKWKNRSLIERFIEYLLLPFRHLF
ncbi:MAG: phosphatidylserine/phosphatidylglycerophosphate/cardiolipin synthase family protein [Bacteroidales bacterium]|jgi:cardiolipin synthase|nr:phosphatidylserine/phosphatidylglycerophosphate/cardiolipin synthase family protein [Bacteroidales bacterium]